MKLLGSVELIFMLLSTVSSCFKVFFRLLLLSRHGLSALFRHRGQICSVTVSSSLRILSSTGIFIDYTRDGLVLILFLFIIFLNEVSISGFGIIGGTPVIGRFFLRNPRIGFRAVRLFRNSLRGFGIVILRDTVSACLAVCLLIALFCKTRRTSVVQFNGFLIAI